MDSPASHSMESGNVVSEKRKRSKYIAKACKDCKRRKVKCSGQQPCQRCGRQMIECVYGVDDSASDSHNIEKLLLQIQSMQSQIDTLSGTVRSLESARPTRTSSRPRNESVSGLVPKTNRDKPLSTGKISFHGLTTSSFNFGIARQSLRNRGITERDRAGDDGDVTQEPSPMPSPSLSPHRDEYQRSIDPLWVINKEEALRLCNVYEEEMGIMYPVLEVDSIISQVNVLYTHLRPPSLSKVPPDSESSVTTLDDDDINILKLVFACALTAEENGHSELGMRIFRSVRDIVSDSMWKPPDIKRAIFLVLVSIFLFQIDEEALAWRFIGTAQRFCLEMGLHRAETFSQPTVTAFGHEKVLKLFWSVYTLDMRWSMGTGMPYHLDFCDIDPSLPRPAGVPYLNSMIGYCRVAEKVWKFITSSSSNDNIKTEQMAYLDWQVTQWSNSIPEPLKLPYPEAIASSPTDCPYRGIWRLKALLYLRANLMKILIYRLVLHTPAQIAQTPIEASTVVNIAKDTIRFITHLNQSTDIYQLQQVAFNWFLISALAVLFLAVAHAPAQFNSSCKDEFYMALELIEGFSMKSYISQRLWRSIGGLRKLAPQIGLWNQRQAPVHQEEFPGGRIRNDQQAVGVQEVAPRITAQDEFLVDGTQMSRELMDWFEAMGEPANSAEGQGFFNEEPWQSTDDFMFGYGSELASILKDCF